MSAELPVTTIVHAIQLAVAPVFLLTGVASILSVLTNRLGRIIDRSRILYARILSEGETSQETEIELASLKRRGQLIHWAIGLCTTCILLVCTVVAVLFLDSLIELDMDLAIASLFIAAMLCLILALVSFIREIFLATSHVRGGL